MSQKKGGMGIEPEGVLKDRAAARFRSAMQEKKEQTTQKKMMAFLYTSCMFLVMVILVIGITLVNNYDRMSNMETAIHQISESLEEEPQEAEEPTEAVMAVPANDGQEGVDDTPSMEEVVLQENQQAAIAEETQDEPAEEPEEAPKEEPAEEAVPEEVPEAAPQEEAAPEPQRYEIKKGDTLLEISRARYGTDDMVRRICELNGLDDGDIIYVGEIILLP